MLINKKKKTCYLVDLARELKNNRGTWRWPWYQLLLLLLLRLEQSQRAWTGEIGNEKKKQNHPDNNTVEICKNTKKSPGKLRRLTVTQTPMKNSEEEQMTYYIYIYIEREIRIYIFLLIYRDYIVAYIYIYRQVHPQRSQNVWGLHIFQITGKY